MDLFVCAGLGLLESLLLDRFWTRNTPTGSTAAPVSPDVTVTVAQAAWSLFLAQYLALKYYRIFLYHKYFSPLRDVPGPSDNHFFFGQALKFYQADTPTELYIRWMREHPDAPFIRYLTWANTEVLVPNSLNANRDVVQTHCYSFSKPPWFLRVVKELGGRGVILMEGEEHRAHRKMLGAPFSLKNIRKLEPIFQEKATDICATFDRRIEESDDKRTGVIDCTDTFSKAILDIMGEAILGINLDYVKQQAGETNGGGGGGKVKGKLANGSSGGNDLTERYTFHEAYRQFFTPGTLGKFLLFANGFVSTRWLPLQANRDFLDAMGWLHEVLRSIIRDRNREVREAVAAGTWETKDSRDLITFIAEESLPGGVAEGIKEDDFLGHLLEFMAAGHDTSANMLSWSLYILVLHQDIQDKLREEVSQLPDNPTYTELEKLPYLENFCKESLRVYPTGKSETDGCFASAV
ncbi:hypothetical protein SLS62_001358 [Diatrype stigma]|uniref:Cytochrome P450 n=1 Tax=Diatrype stigma TaxID=117547 RepID=A0AAN9UY56_9PEZI